MQGTVEVVEDNPANMQPVKFILEHAGYRVRCAENALDGIALARGQAPHLMLMDIQPPGMDGLETTRVLKADPATRGIPVIALTAFAMKGEEERIRAAGCEGYIAKPNEYRLFLAEVAWLLATRGRTTE